MASTRSRLSIVRRLLHSCGKDFFKVAIPFKRAFFLAPGSPTGKWANSEVLPLGGDSARRLPPFKVNTRCGPDRRFYCACDFAALLKISVGRGSFYQGAPDRTTGEVFPQYIAEKYTNIASEKPDYHGGLPIARLRKVEDYVRVHLAESISIEKLAELTELSSFHFSRVFKQATGMTPLQFVIRERMLLAQQLIRETSRSLIEIALEVGYTNPSHFAQVFRRTAGMVPTEFRMLLE